MGSKKLGRSLLVLNGNHYTMFDQILRAWDDSLESMKHGWDDYARHLESIDYPHDFIALSSTCAPIMWDNAPPNPFLPPLIERWNREMRIPAIRYATLDDVRERTRHPEPSTGNPEPNPEPRTQNSEPGMTRGFDSYDRSDC